MLNYLNRYSASIEFKMGNENYIADVFLTNDEFDDIFFFINEGEDEDGVLDLFIAENDTLLKRNKNFVQRFVELAIDEKNNN